MKSASVEYKIINTSDVGVPLAGKGSSSEQLQQGLNKLGRQGWTLRETRGNIMIFSREKNVTLTDGRLVMKCTKVDWDRAIYFFDGGWKMSSVHGYMVKFQHKPTSKCIVIFEVGHSLADAFDEATKTITTIMQREAKGFGSPEDIAKKPDDPKVMNRWEVVSVSCVDVEVR